jgi:hypothetical protein
MLTVAKVRTLVGKHRGVSAERPNIGAKVQVLRTEGWLRVG